MLRCIRIQFTQGGGASLLLIHFLFDTCKAGQRAAVVKTRERRTDPRLSLRPPSPSDQELFFCLRVLNLRFELMHRFLELLDLLSLLVVLGLEAVSGLL